jgi:hypothetical protein
MLPSSRLSAGTPLEHLEKTVDSLRELPARVTGVEVRVTAVEEQVVQLRGEMRDGFSAVLQVIDASSVATQRLIDEARAETKQGFADVRTEMAQGFATVRVEITQGLTDVRTEMRVLHEDLVERIARIGEGGSRKRPRH